MGVKTCHVTVGFSSKMCLDEVFIFNSQLKVFAGPFLWFSFLALTNTCFQQVSCEVNELLPNRSTWATNYYGTLYSLTVCDSLPLIVWNIFLSDGRNDTASVVVFTNNTFVKQFNYTGFNASVEHNTTCVTSHFSVTNPLNETMDQSHLEVSFDVEHPRTIDIFVNDCLSNLSDNVSVVSSLNPGYKDSGVFTCPRDGKLFYSCGKELLDNTTVCLESAQWLGQSDLQCWSAPKVQITTNSTHNEGLEGDVLLMSCSYYNTLPSGCFSIFYIGFSGRSMPKNDSYPLSLSREYNGTIISCQADTPYTQIHNNTGRSQPITLQVFYGPTTASVNVSLEPSIQYFGSKVFLNSSQTVNLTCISDANPPAACTWMFNLTQISTSCHTSYSIDQSGSVSCNVENLYGNTRTSLEIVVLGERTPNISSSDGNAINEGQWLNLGCSIAYQNELASTFTWITPNESINSAQLQFNTINRSDSGQYTCHTNDNFGSYFTSVHLDVFFAPESDESVSTCFWEEVINKACFFEFYSYPTTRNYSLTNAGLPVYCKECDFQSNQDFQRFFLILEPTDKHEEYLLEITSNEFPNNPLTTTFQIRSENNKGNSDEILIIAASVVGAVLLILILFGGVFAFRRYYTPNEESQSSGNNEIHGVDNDAVIPEDNCASVDLRKKNENAIVKEEVINPIYGRSDDVTKSEARETGEDRVNPLFVPNVTTNVPETYAEVKKIPKPRSDKATKKSLPHCSNISNAMETYAVVDKTKKGFKINEKEEKQNPLYGSYAADLHSNTSSTDHKEERINPLYSTSYETSELNEDSPAHGHNSLQEHKGGNSGTKQKLQKPPIRKKPTLISKKPSDT